MGGDDEAHSGGGKYMYFSLPIYHWPAHIFYGISVGAGYGLAGISYRIDEATQKVLFTLVFTCIWFLFIPGKGEGRLGGEMSHRWQRRRRRRSAICRVHTYVCMYIQVCTVQYNMLCASCISSPLLSSPLLSSPLLNGKKPRGIDLWVWCGGV